MSKNTLKALLHFAGGHTLSEEDDGPARRMQLIMLVAAASALLCAIYGLAAGSSSLSMALGNTVKVPAAVLLSGVGALPAGLLTWKLTGSDQRPSDLVMGVASGTFSASLVLAVLAPLVALYYHTSGYLGGVLAMGACTLALLTGVGVTVRTVVVRARRWQRAVAPLVVMVVVQLATLAQLVHAVAPILPEETVFDGGMDAILDV